MTLKNRITRLNESEISQTIIWLAAFTGVTVLVALGKVKPEALEMLLFAVVGRASAGKGNLRDNP